MKSRSAAGSVESRPSAGCRLVLVLGDQLDLNSSLLTKLDPRTDVIWMAEAIGEAVHVWCHKYRVILFLSAMRHFRDSMRQKGWTVDYQELVPQEQLRTLGDKLEESLHRLRPRQVLLIEPGEYRVKQEIARVLSKWGVTHEFLEDPHFLVSTNAFKAYADGRSGLRMEYFYRWVRRDRDLLMVDGKPAGDQWNFDADNRESFGKQGPAGLPEPYTSGQDATSREVAALVDQVLPDNPGVSSRFAWPVTRKQALAALDCFIDQRLPRFGTYQDAMWEGEATLFHSLLSSSLNLKLLNPREVVDAAITGYQEGRAPLAAVEGFVRQIIGWREYVRGIYHRFMPEYLERNFLQACRPLPRFYFTGETDMNCLRVVINETFEAGYSHHIQRLMVSGLFALLYGANPKHVHEWFLGVYVDAVEWVELPNSLGMSQFGDGGIMASKPYIASGKYIQRMSNYCRGCRFDPGKRTGENACPYTVLYWDFLFRYEKTFEGNRRMTFQIRNAQRINSQERGEIQRCADKVRAICE